MNLPKLQSDLESVSPDLHVPVDTKVESSDVSIDFENFNGTTEILDIEGGSALSTYEQRTSIFLAKDYTKNKECILAEP